MGDARSALGARFNQAVDEFAALVEDCTDDQWQMICFDEGWTIAAAADHVTNRINLERDWIAKIALDEPMVPLALGAVNAFNDRRA
jgi:hypothetical protein